MSWHIVGTFRVMSEIKGIEIKGEIYDIKYNKSTYIVSNFLEQVCSMSPRNQVAHRSHSSR